MSLSAYKNSRAAKITEQQVQQIRDIYSGGRASQREIAEVVNLSTQQVGRIIRGECWRKVPMALTQAEVAASQERLLALLREEMPEKLPQGVEKISLTERIAQEATQKLQREKALGADTLLGELSALPEDFLED